MPVGVGAVAAAESSVGAGAVGAAESAVGASAVGADESSVGAGAVGAAESAVGADAAAATGPAVCAAEAAESSVSAATADEVHISAGHRGVRRTLYFARRCIGPAVTRAQARAAVDGCDVCRAIDPAPVRWRHGTLDEPETWQRLAIDVTHLRGQSYLTMIDCGPSRYCLWRLLRREDSASVTEKLEEVFYERGAPVEILCDNDTAFRSRYFAAFADRWNVTLRFRAAHVPSGNGIVERNHRTVKVIAARKQCSVAEAVHLYNVTPRDGEEADDSPASRVYRYAVRDCVQPRSDQSAAPGGDPGPAATHAPAAEEGGLSVGDSVWVRQHGTRCSEQSKRGTVSGLVSQQVVEVDGVPRHVRDLRRCVEQAPPFNESTDEDDDLPLFVDVPVSTAPAPVDVRPPVSPALRAETSNVPTPQSSTARTVPVLRRSQRVHRPPRKWCCVCDLDGQGGV